MYYAIEGTNTRILGSFHLFPKDAPPPPARIAEAFDWAQSLCVEHTHAELQPFMTLPAGGSLEALIPPSTWKVLTSFWPAASDVADLRRLKLWAAFVSVARFVVDGVPGVEADLMGTAQAAGKPVFWLESGAEFASCADRMPASSLAQAIAENSEPTRARELFRALHAAWLTGEGAAVWGVMSQMPMAAVPELYDGMFASRNRMWAGRIPGIARDRKERFLLTVGAGHLVGPGNVIDLLRAKGLTISRI